MSAVAWAALIGLPLAGLALSGLSILYRWTTSRDREGGAVTDLLTCLVTVLLAVVVVLAVWVWHRYHRTPDLPARHTPPGRCPTRTRHNHGAH